MEAPKKLEHFSVDASLLRQSPGLRLDASFYNPAVAHAIERIRRSGLPVKTLGDLTKEVFIPPRFARVYVGSNYGLPFLQGSHIVQFQAADLKYVSTKVHRNIEKWVIREGWILVTRSGSVGRVAIAPRLWDGWAASEHILRIIPDEKKCPAGYLAAFLMSSVGQAQLTAQIYGAVVDELTEDQTKGVLVPVPKTKGQHEKIEEIDKIVRASVKKRAEAASLATGAVARAEDLMPKIEGEEAYESFEDSPRKPLAGHRSEIEQQEGRYRTREK
jgi:hypothetical protein